MVCHVSSGPIKHCYEIVDCNICLAKDNCDKPEKKEYVTLEVHRRISFKGRTNLGYAHWKYKGIKNVISLYLNKITEHTSTLHKYPTHTKMFEQLFIYYFTLVDFHEWLHLFIRRVSGVKNTYFVDDNCHDWIQSVELALVDVWYDTIVEPEHQRSLEPYDIPLVSILERDLTIGGV